MAPRAKGASSRAGYGSSALLSEFVFYGAYHSNWVNQAIHLVCIPMIVLTLLVFLAEVPAPRALVAALPPLPLAALPAPLAAALRAARPTAALGVAGAYAAYYLWLCASARLPALGAAAAAGVLALWAAAEHLSLAHGAAALRPAAAAHVLAWLAQFYGHGVHERRAPALMQSVPQAFRVAPLFVLVEAAFALGLLAEFRAAAQPSIDKAVAEFRAEQAKKASAAAR